MIDDIKYWLVSEATRAYESAGYSLIDVPWMVSAEAYNITAPVSGTAATTDAFVASGEQGFMHLILEGRLTEGKYCCATPCYRPWDAGRSNLHLSQFFKVELIQFSKLELFRHSMSSIIDDAYRFLSQRSLTLLEVIPTKDEERQFCQTIASSDIITEVGEEVGSYGVRYHPRIGYWAYGTGLALPRFTQLCF